MAQILEAVSKELDIEGLQDFVTKAQEAIDKVPVLEALVVELSKKSEDALAEKIESPIARKMAWSRPSQSADTVLDETDDGDAKLKKSKPQSHWLADQAGVEPVSEV
jgi:tetrahydromethanopterin S-methyltransferase subunit A